MILLMCRTILLQQFPKIFNSWRLLDAFCCSSMKSELSCRMLLVEKHNSIVMNKTLVMSRAERLRLSGTNEKLV